MSVQLALADLAKYPFLSEAGKYVKDLDIGIEDLGQDDYASVVDRARQRVVEAIEHRRVSEEFSNPEVELLSFPLAMAMVKSTGLEHLASRYALSEALRVERLLENEKSGIVAYVFRNALNVELSEVSTGIQGRAFSIPFTAFLGRSTAFHEPEWSLVNRRLQGGRVYLNTRDLVRLIREEIRGLVHERIRSLAVPKLPDRIQQVVQEVASLTPLPRRIEDITPTSPDKYPPCVRHCLDMLKKGENLPHFARFLMTTYLLNIGKTVDDVIALYPRVPDFNERITRYQVEHLAGLRGGRVKYRVPSCKNAVLHSFCFKDSVYCPFIRNPIQYGRRPFPIKKKAKRGG